MRLVARLATGLLLTSIATGPLRAASAATCGDADGNGAVTVTDGVQTLRQAAALPSTCPDRVCDTDGQGQVTVSDGVAVLRAAAALPVKLASPSRSRRSVAAARTSIGSAPPTRIAPEASAATSSA